MDPRLAHSPIPQPHNPVQDLAHPVAKTDTHSPRPQVPQPMPQAATPQPHAPTNSVSQPMTPQIVQSFPVKQPEGLQQPSTPSLQVIQGSAPLPQAEDDLDKILQAVNNRVKSPTEKPETKKAAIGKKILSKTPKIKTSSKASIPFGPVIVVLVVVLMLCVTAVFAYRDGSKKTTASAAPSKVGTSYLSSGAIQDAGGALVHPADLDNYAQTLQTKVKALNDSQDFMSSSLSDQVLGL